MINMYNLNLEDVNVLMLENARREAINARARKAREIERLIAELNEQDESIERLEALIAGMRKKYHIVV